MKTLQLYFALVACLLTGAVVNAQTFSLGGKISNTTVPVSITAKVLGTSITFNSDSTGNYSRSITVSGTQGSIEVSIINCHGKKVSKHTVWHPGNMSGVLNFDYCPKVPKSCTAGFRVSKVYRQNTPVPNNVIIYNTSKGSNLSYKWDFGDGTTSTKAKPAHFFSGNGPYKVCLTVTSGTCTDTYCKTISIGANGHLRKTGFTLWVDEVDESKLTTSIAPGVNGDAAIRFFPNPAHDEVNISFGELVAQEVTIELINVSGQVVYNEVVSGSENLNIDLSGFDNGVYFIRYQSEQQLGTARLVVE